MIKDLRLSRRAGSKKRSNGRDLIGVSEAVGTVLLLGVSVIMVSGIALWTTNIDEGEEGLYIDLVASVQDNLLVISHKGGDFLEGSSTTIIIRNSSGAMVYEDTYSVLSGTNDDQWGPGEDLRLDISNPSITSSFEVLVIGIKEGGTSTIILRDTLYKTAIASGLPDLAITMLRVEDSDATPTTSIYSVGTSLIRVKLVNFGTPMSEVYFTENPDHTIKNFVLFDPQYELEFEDVVINHYRSGVLKNISDADWMILQNGDEAEFVFTWETNYLNPRTLGLHDLNAKIVPYINGEINYRNNYVTRSFKVDKEIEPIVIHGPDPGIYDISFSNNVPNSGDDVTVTVIIQNSGDEPIELDHHVAMVVSTWKPELMGEYGYEMHNFRVDDPINYGQWKSDIPTSILTNDDTFPTCVKTDIQLLPGAYFFYYFTLEARVDVPGGQQWVYAAIDVYHNDGYPQGISYLNGDDPDDNFRLGNIQVLPKIMVVDDDGEPMGSEDDMTSAVIESLVGAGVTIDKIYIAQQVEDNGTVRDAPAFSYYQDEIPAPAMEDYDIVIWVTGASEDALTNTPRTLPDDPGGNIQNLMDYMDNNRYLLIIGSSPFHDLALNHLNAMDASQPQSPSDPADQDASDFLFDYAGISRIHNDEDLPWSDQIDRLVGVDTGEDGVTQLNMGETEYLVTLNDQVENNQNSQKFTLRQTDVPDHELPLPIFADQDDIDLNNGLYFGHRMTSTPSGVHNASYKFGVISFNLNDVRYLNEKIDIISGFLNWFDWEISVGRDLSITKMELFVLTETAEDVWSREPVNSTNVPKYLDTIEIEVTVRNNGPSIESTSLLFYATGPDGVELPVVANNPDPRPTDQIPDYGSRTDDNPQDISGIAGGGGEVTVYKLWLAVGVGFYTFRVIVDPFRLISEISEENNDITYSTSTITSFVTQNNLLVIDDDDTEDNFDNPALASSTGVLQSYPNGEPSGIIEQALDDLTYQYETYTILNVMNGSWEWGSGPGILDLKRYNSIIWVTGDSGNIATNELETLTQTDILNLLKYLEGRYDESSYLDEKHNESVVFFGTNLIGDLSVNDTVITQDTLTISTHDFLRKHVGVEPAMNPLWSGDLLSGPSYGNYLWDIYTGASYYDIFFDGGQFDMRQINLSSGPGLTTREGLFGRVGNQQVLTGGQLQMQDQANKIYYRSIVHSWDISAMFHDTSGPFGMELPLHEMIYLTLHWFNTPENRPELISRNSMIFFENDNPVLGNSYIITIQIANVGGAPGGGTVRWMDGSTLIKSENIYLEPNKLSTLEAIWTPLFAGIRNLTIWIDNYDDYDEVFDIYNNIPYQNKRVYFFWDDMEGGDENWYHDSTEIMINGEGKLDYMEEPTYLNIDNEWETMDGFYNNYDVSNPVVSREAKSEPNSYMMHEPAGSGVKSVDVALVIDSSGSMGENYDDNDPDNVRKSAAKEFVDNMYDEDRVVVFDFDNNVDRLTDLSEDKTEAKSAIGDIDSDGSTALYDAGVEALGYMGTNARDEDEAIRAVVILTDGYDTASSYSLAQYRNVRDQYDDNPSTEEKIFVFTIRLVDGDEAVLQSMCSQPWEEGPYYFFANDASDLDQIYTTIREIIQDLAQASTRSSGPTRSTRAEAKEIWSDQFPYPTRFDMESTGNWRVISGDPDPVNKESNSTPYCIELEGTDTLESRSVDLSSYKNAFIEFYWRGGRDATSEGQLERGEELYVDINIRGTWVTGYYTVNNNCFTTPWTRERIKLPSEALWSGFQIRFRASTGSATPAYDAYYVDDFKLFVGTFGPGSIGRQDLNYWSDGVSEVRNKSIETSVIDLTNVDEIELSFFHKYNMKRGANGGVLMIGVALDPLGPFTYVYTQPDQPYTGNTLITAWDSLLDDLGNSMRWCWNGISGSGTLDWDFVTVDLSDYSGFYIKIKFQYLHTFGGTGYGWFLDDLKVTVNSDKEDLDKFETNDNWKLIDGDDASDLGIGGTSHSWSGDQSWYFGDPVYSGGDFKDGIDSSLYTRQIDLTNAKTAFFSAFFKFNLDRGSGRPPDGFRIEVSTDNGNSWVTVSLGVRSAWGVSGADEDIADGVLDFKTYTGLDLGDYWTHSSTMTRLITNLNGFTGNVITMRFRIVTNTATTHNDMGHTFSTPEEEFMGFFMDDVVVYGESLEGTRNSAYDRTRDSSLGDRIGETTTENEMPGISIKEERSGASQIGDGQMTDDDLSISFNEEGSQETRLDTVAGSEGDLGIPVILVGTSLLIMMGLMVRYKRVKRRKTIR